MKLDAYVTYGCDACWKEFLEAKKLQDRSIA